MEPNPPDEKTSKILLMGNASAGKTSMRAIIFSNFSPKDTFLLGWTNSISSNQMNYLGNLVLNLLDCGGQDRFIKEYFDTKRAKLFDKVKVLIFVLEAERVKTQKEQGLNDLEYFEKCIQALSEYSYDAKVFVLINKMDLISEQRKTLVYERKKHEIMERASGFDVQCYPTSMWDNTLYKAWTDIVSSLIMDKDGLKKALDLLLEACDAQEIILFEKNTFLTTCYTSKSSQIDESRFGKISQLIKKMKLSFCNKQFLSLVIQGKRSTMYLDEFTSSTYVMVVLNHSSINVEVLALNIEMTRKSFEDLITPPSADEFD